MSLNPIPYSSGTTFVDSEAPTRVVVYLRPDSTLRAKKSRAASRQEWLEIEAVKKKVTSLALAIFGSLPAVIDHFFTHDLHMVCFSVKFPKAFKREIALLTHKLRFFTDYDIARKSVKKMNKERVAEKDKLSQKFFSLCGDLEGLKDEAKILKRKIEKLKSVKQKAEYEYRRIKKLISILTSNNSSPKVRPQGVKDIFTHSHFNTLTIIKKSLENRIVLKKKEFKTERNALTIESGKIKEQIDLLTKELESPKYLNLPNFLSEMKEYPLLLCQVGNKKVILSFNQSTLQIAKILNISSDVVSWLQNGIAAKGMKFFLEKTIPGIQMDYQSITLLEKLTQHPEKTLIDLLEERDVLDSVMLSPYVSPITLTCGHTFSAESIQTENKCPHCREMINYNEILPNNFISQLTLIFNKKQQTIELNNLLKLVPVDVSERVQFLDQQLEEIKQKELLMLAFDKSFKSIQKKYKEYYQEVESEINSDDPYLECLTKLEQQLDNIQGKIFLTKASIQNIEGERAALKYFSNSEISQMAQTLAGSYQTGDLTAIIPMDIAKKEYVNKLKQKIEKVEKDLAAAEYMRQYYTPEFFETMENINEVWKALLAEVAGR